MTPKQMVHLVLVDLCWVDVDVDDARIDGKRLQLAWGEKRK
jgi:hypothetical protein